MGHYLQLQLTVGKGFERVYFPLASPDETKAEAVSRWLDDRVKGRKRNVAKARELQAKRIEQSRLCHPTSWYRDNELGAFAPAESRPKRKRRR